MNKSRCVILTFLLVIIFVTACTGNPATSAPNETPLATPFPTFHITGSTEYDELIDSPLAKSDGVLSLKISEIDSGCYSKGNLLKIKFTFKNLSNGVLILPAFRVVDDKGDVIPIITNAENTILPSLKAPQGFIYYVIPTPASYSTVPAHGTLDRVIDFYLPAYLLEQRSMDNYAMVTPGPGRYFIKFLYFNWNDNLETSWTGLISSNRIEVCLTE